MPAIDRNNLVVPQGTDIVLAGGEDADAVQRALTNNPLSRVFYIEPMPEIMIAAKFADEKRFVLHDAHLGRWNKADQGPPFDLKVPFNFGKDGKLDWSLATTLPDFDDKTATAIYGRSSSGAAIPSYVNGEQIDDGQLQHVLRRKVNYRTLDSLVPADANVSVITLRVGGREDDALQGARGTITRCRPWVLYHCDEALFGAAALRTRGDAIAWCKAITGPLNYEHFFMGEGGRLTHLDSFDEQLHARAIAAPGYQPRGYDFRVVWFVAAPRAR